MKTGILKIEARIWPEKQVFCVIFGGKTGTFGGKKQVLSVENARTGPGPVLAFSTSPGRFFKKLLSFEKTSRTGPGPVLGFRTSPGVFLENHPF